MRPVVRPAALLWLVGLLVGCGGEGEGGSGDLMRIDAVEPGDECAQGGLAVSVGADSDGDGALSDEEIASTQLVCNGVGQDGEDGEDGVTTLVETAEEEPGENCEHGGVVVESGLDLDADGELDPDEVSSTRFVCDGADGVGLTSLVSVQEEAAGESCELGGLAIRSGVDENSDGLLQPEEVLSTEYVCNGEPGEDGSGGLSSLVRQEDASEADCLFGGRLVLSGLDADADGYLDDEEVEDTSTVCNGEPGEPGHASLFVLTEEEPGGACEAGGFLIESGLDSDDDGELDEGEVMGTSTLCHGLNGEAGAAGQESLVALTDVDPGDGCGAVGGVRVQSGLDLDADGELDEGEVSSTRYLCDGEAGEDGSAGLRSLVVVTDEPAGAHCASGGVMVESGLDEDGDGALASGEVEVTSYVCDGGGVVVRATNAEWGGVCAWAGGVKLESGVDDDRDGILDDGEVDTTQYVCNLFFSQISAGDFHSCAVVSDGTARCWGRNNYGQLGDGTTTERHDPVAVSGLTGVAEIAAGGDHTCTRQTDGTARCWGRNDYGQLGDSTETDRHVPVAVSGLTGVAELSASSYHTCSVRTDGTARCWGGNFLSQLGDGTTTDRTTPVTVSGLNGVAQISAGVDHTCTRQTDGTARCWGYNGNGQLGDNTTTASTTPVVVSSLTGVAEISTGDSHTCSRQTDGTARCWGDNSYGRIGDGTTTDRHVPVAVSGLTGIAEISASHYHTCSRQTDGTARCWGTNWSGQLGDGTETSRSTPTLVSGGLTSFAQIAAGGDHTCTLQTDGSARCWGYNGQGQLGDGTETNRSTPVRVVGELAP